MVTNGDQLVRSGLYYVGLDVKAVQDRKWSVLTQTHDLYLKLTAAAVAKQLKEVRIPFPNHHLHHHWQSTALSFIYE